MAYDRLGPAGLDYAPCRYGGSRVLFRGPRADLTAPHIVFLGGTACYGKFIAQPFPALVEDRIGMTCVNLGAVNAGPDLYLNDPALLRLAQGAAVTVLQIPGAPNLSNRYYSVHPRRNDRFVQASALLRRVFRDADFSAYHFTRHMLHSLQELSSDRFAVVVEELKQAWVGRMAQLIREIAGPVVLLWMADHGLDDRPGLDVPVPLQSDPLFVDRDMVEQLRPHVVSIVEATASDAARARGVEGMVFSQMEAAAAQSQLGVGAHEEASAALVPVLGDLIPAF